MMSRKTEEDKIKSNILWLTVLAGIVLLATIIAVAGYIKSQNG